MIAEFQRWAAAAAAAAAGGVQQEDQVREQGKEQGNQLEVDEGHGDEQLPQCKQQQSQQQLGRGGGGGGEHFPLGQVTSFEHITDPAQHDYRWAVCRSLLKLPDLAPHTSVEDPSLQSAELSFRHLSKTLSSPRSPG